MPRKIRRPKATPRLMAIVQERRAALAVEEALAQNRIDEVIDHPSATSPKDAAASRPHDGATDLGDALFESN